MSQILNSGNGGGGGSTNHALATGDVYLTVSTGGNDSNPARPSGVITHGDWSAYPFLTPQAAINSLPKISNGFGYFVQCGAGGFPGAVVEGFMGSKVSSVYGVSAGLVLSGTYTLYALVTGLNTGTAGAGTTTTSLVKPTGSANWAVNDMQGKFLVIDSGGGASTDPRFLTVRPILSNTTTTVTFLGAISELDNTSVYRVTTDDTTFGKATSQSANRCLCVQANEMPIIVQGIVPNMASMEIGIFAELGSSVTVDGCDIFVPGSNRSVLLQRLQSAAFNNSIVSVSSTVTEQINNRNNLQNIMGITAGNITLSTAGFTSATSLNLSNSSDATAALTLQTTNSATVSAAVISGSSGAAVLYDRCVYGNVSTLTGTSNTTYGLKINYVGQINVQVSTTVTGTSGDILFQQDSTNTATTTYAALTAAKSVVSNLAGVWQ